VSIRKIEPGFGRIAVENQAPQGHVFSELSCTYPLKLLSPKTAQDRLAIVYILTYGGGLVGGDSISLFVDAGPGSTLVLLSQVDSLRISPHERSDAYA
jgi:urease accessory protein